MSRVKTVPAEQVQDVGATILEHLDLKTGESLVLIEGDDFVLVKRALAPSPSARFEALSAETQARFERTGVEPGDVDRAIRWARESS